VVLIANNLMTRCGPIMLVLPATSTFQVIIRDHRFRTRMQIRVQGQREVGIGFDIMIIDSLAITTTAAWAEPIIVLYRANTRYAHVAGEHRRHARCRPILVATSPAAHVEVSVGLIWYNSRAPSRWSSLKANEIPDTRRRDNRAHHHVFAMKSVSLSSGTEIVDRPAIQLQQHLG
jgi:hypothetical protein